SAVGMSGATCAAIRHGVAITCGQLAVYLLCLVVLSGVCAAVVWRARFPVVVCLSTAAAGVLLPVGALAPLLALPFVLAREARRRVVAGSVAASVVSVGVSLGRDAARGGGAVLFSFT